MPRFVGSVSALILFEIPIAARLDRMFHFWRKCRLGQLSLMQSWTCFNPDPNTNRPIKEQCSALSTTIQKIDCGWSFRCAPSLYVAPRRRHNRRTPKNPKRLNSPGKLSQNQTPASKSKQKMAPLSRSQLANQPTLRCDLPVRGSAEANERSSSMEKSRTTEHKSGSRTPFPMGSFICWSSFVRSHNGIES